MSWIHLQKPTAYTLARCELFATHSVSTSTGEYARRNQHSIAKIRDDIYRGKVAEYMVYDFLIFKGNETSLPDIEIYEAKRKSFDADLVSNGYNVHVKSHTRNPNYPVSWVFQKSDKLTQGSDDFLALVVMDEDFNAKMHLGQAKHFVFRPPVNESLRSKACIYADDIVDF